MQGQASSSGVAWREEGRQDYDHQMNAISAAMSPMASPNFINRAIQFESGPFKGRTVRSQLIEVQKADLGRKFARRDRRPLDPPNVAEAFFYESVTYEDGSVHEHMIPSEEIETSGFMCHVDLFPMVGNTAGGSHADPNMGAVLQLPPREDTKQTVNLWTASFSHAAKLPRCPSGNMYGRTSDDRWAIYFPFPDLSIQVEGVFFFRYRFFDINSACIGPNGLLGTPIMAETFGGLVTIYSTKEFPGLKASTNLTKHLSLHGVKVNLRETERKRSKRKKGGDDEDDEGEGGEDGSVSVAHSQTVEPGEDLEGGYQ